ncbi:MAG: hypothetical protein ABSC23_07805 [Bryobacteraceae bacterium]|jgi:hypothetical protein
MALVGYQVERQKINDKIKEIQAQVKGENAPTPSVAPEKKAGGRKRTLSAAARRRISAAQKKRWAEHRKRLAAG